MKFFLLFSIFLIGAANGQLIDGFLCWFRSCPPGTFCQIENWHATCVVPLPPPEPTCDGIFCARRSTCRMVWPFGCRSEECKPHPYCVEVNHCRNKRCHFHEECVLVERFCVKEPCHPSAVCRPRKIPLPPTGTCLCSHWAGCAMVRPMECGNENEEACPVRETCVETNACAVTLCQEGFACVLHEVECLEHPCNPIAVCEALESNEVTVSEETSGTTVTEATGGTTESEQTEGTTESMQTNGTTVSLQFNGTTESVQFNATMESVLLNGTTESLQFNATTESLHFNGTTVSFQFNGTTESVLFNGTTEGVQFNVTTEGVQTNWTTESVHLNGTTESVQFNGTTVSLQNNGTTASLQNNGTTVIARTNGTTVSVRINGTTLSG